MRHFRIAGTAALVATLGLSQPAWADAVKIGFLSTLSGPASALGMDIRDGFKLAVKHHDGKLGGLEAKLIIVDDQQSPDAAKQTTDRLIKRDKVDFMTGIVFSNVLLAVAPPIFASKTYYVSPNAGPSQLAGKQCNPYFFSASYQNDNMHEATGKVVQARGFKKVALLAPNYPGGRNAIEGFKRYYKGEVAAEILTPLQQLDYGTELSQIRASGADALFFFLPGGLGINFIKQFSSSGLGEQLALFGPGFSADEDVLSAVGDAALGMFNAGLWAHDLPGEANQRFVADFQKEYGRMPSSYAAQGYDTAQLIASAIQKVDGNLKDKEALGKALKQADFTAVRGPFSFNSNHFPIQNYYLREVVKNEQGRVTNRLVGTVFERQGDAYASACEMGG